MEGLDASQNDIHRMTFTVHSPGVRRGVFGRGLHAQREGDRTTDRSGPLPCVWTILIRRRNVDRPPVIRQRSNERQFPLGERVCNFQAPSVKRDDAIAWDFRCRAKGPIAAIGGIA
jgi:hypothetical protein